MKARSTAEAGLARWFTRNSGVPLVLLVGMYWQAVQTEARGAMAVAAAYGPIILGVSVATGVVSLALWTLERRRGTVDRALLAATVLASAPLLMVGARMIWFEFARGL